MDFEYVSLNSIKNDSVIISIDPKNLFKLFLDCSVARNHLYKTRNTINGWHSIPFPTAQNRGTLNLHV